MIFSRIARTYTLSPQMRRFRPCVLISLACLLLAGCGHEKCEESARQSQDRIRQLQEDGTKLAAQVSEASQQAATLTREQAELKDTIARLSQEIAEKNAEIAAQSQTIEKAKAYVAKLTQRNVAPKKVAPDSLQQSRIDDMIHRPVAPVADLFPVVISNQQGKKVLAGTHKETNWERDAVQPYAGAGYGHWDTDTVKDFSYVVTFSARNLTKTAKTFVVEAGGSQQSISLAPGQTLDNLTVDAVKGRHLQIICGSESRTITVPWP